MLAYLYSYSLFDVKQSKFCTKTNFIILVIFDYGLKRNIFSMNTAYKFISSVAILVQQLATLKYKKVWAFNLYSKYCLFK